MHTYPRELRQSQFGCAPRFGETSKRVGTAKAGEIVAVIVGMIVAWMGQPDKTLYAAVLGAFDLFILDYTTAHAAALYAGEAITTAKFREMTNAKILSYRIGVSAFVIVGLIIRSWLPVIGIFSLVAYAEALSNIENLRKLAVYSGKTGTFFLGNVFRFANRFLGELPGLKEVGAEGINISQQSTTSTTSSVHTETQITVPGNDNAGKQEVGTK